MFSSANKENIAALIEVLKTTINIAKTTVDVFGKKLHDGEVSKNECMTMVSSAAMFLSSIQATCTCLESNELIDAKQVKSIKELRDSASMLTTGLFCFIGTNKLDGVSFLEAPEFVKLSNMPAAKIKKLSTDELFNQIRKEIVIDGFVSEELLKEIEHIVVSSRIKAGKSDLDGIVRHNTFVTKLIRFLNGLPLVWLTPSVSVKLEHWGAMKIFK